MSLRSEAEGSLFLLRILDNYSISISMSPWIVSLIIAIVLLGLIWRAIFVRGISWSETSFSVCGVTSKFCPDHAEKQIAYEIWVEISTRKIGLPIDLENDVIIEIYNSWYDFFSISRELIRKIPARKLNDKGTGFIIDASIRILNQQLRVHLTKWQARYRRWYKSASQDVSLDPQDIQQKYPQYDLLVSSMLSTNMALIQYRKEMYRLATGVQEPNLFEEDIGKLER